MSDWFNKVFRDYNPTYHILRNTGLGKLSEAVTGRNFIDDTYSDLNLAKMETFMSGFPIIGGVVNGINGSRQLEDYYNNTGYLPRYGPLQMAGASGLGRAVAGGYFASRPDNTYKSDPRSGTRSIHDLYLYY